MSEPSTFQRLLENYRNDHQHPMNRATHMLGIPMIVVSLPLFFFSLWWALGLFVVGWILQFIGHAFEGNQPSFFRDPRFLLVGPMFIVKKYRQLFRPSAPSAES
jgi:uncharacterized membrane protein YGL010W